MIKTKKPTLLLMACCGPCACAVFAHGLHEKYDIAMFFYGNNFDSKEEYTRRLEALVKVNKELNNDKEMIVLPYTAHDFYKQEESNRCRKCINIRLLETAYQAKKCDFDSFSTSLTVSPYKNSREINIIGSYIGLEWDIPFLELDLKADNGFQKSIEISKCFGLYRQKYCGCKYSIRKD